MWTIVNEKEELGSKISEYQKWHLGGRLNLWVIHFLLIKRAYLMINLLTHHAPRVKLTEIFKATANKEQESKYSHLGEGRNKLSL